MNQIDYNNIRLLVVGAGGIGCELLKNLVLTGFSNIEVIDLDTIELSNLNRQFLFQKIHVGQPKAKIARDSVLRFNPNANIIAHHDSIMNTKYNVEYFKQFALVLNALDNKAARSHVNRLCLAADVPLIESGSAGYLGQITLIKKGITECYDCLPKPAAKSFPGCTIRNTPSEPIHCIVWAKHLFNQLFGPEDADEAVSPDAEDPENMADAGKNANEKTSEIVRVSTRIWAKQTNYDAEKIFNKLFNDDIKYLLSMSKLWEKRKPPEPIDFYTVNNNDNNNKIDEQTSNGTKIESQKIWSIKECLKYFCSSLNLLSKKLGDSNELLVWDKDDEDCLNFVTAAANLRSHIFSIAIKSKFDVKSLAGNIIPAIATTNAIIAGLIVLQAAKIIKNNLKDCKTVYLRDIPLQQKLIVSSELVKPNKNCYVCASHPELTIKLNTDTMTLKTLETKILKLELNMISPDVEIDDGSGRIIISSEEGETEENNDKVLSNFGLKSGSRLKSDDFHQNYQLNITLIHEDKFENGKEYEILADSGLLQDLVNKPKTENNIPENNKNNNNHENNNDIEIVVYEEKKKRSLSLEETYEDNIVTKKRKLQIENNHDNNDICIEEVDNKKTANNVNNNGNNNEDDIIEIDTNGVVETKID